MTIPPRQTETARAFSPRPQNSLLPSRRLVPTSLILLALSVVLAGLVSFWMTFSTDDENIELVVSSATVTRAGEMEITGASYTGRTATGKAFEITAETARENREDARLIELVAPVGKLDNGPGSRIELRALSGLMDTGSRDMDLRGEVVVTDSAHALTLRTEHLIARLADGFMSSPSAVAVTATNLQINAAGMTASEDGSHILFTGPSRLIKTRSEAAK
ncbi:MAG: LPS export ABC transporter periplasmic protein LptC [Alphaproteobacteria bacterium]|nr:LPS export ABC transporter periplasmic protein LptC [Alphaproteobacteria bacterium]